MEWFSENAVGLLGVLGGLTVAAVAVHNARLKQRETSASIEAQWAIQMISDLPDGILRVDGNDQITYCNVQASLMTKYHSRELIGMNVNSLLPTRFRKKHPAFTRGYRNAPRTRAMGTSGTELYMIDKRGEEARVLIYLKQMEPIDNGPETLVVVRDFNEQVKIMEHAGAGHMYPRNGEGE